MAQYLCVLIVEYSGVSARTAATNIACAGKTLVPTCILIKNTNLNVVLMYNEHAVWHTASIYHRRVLTYYRGLSLAHLTAPRSSPARHTL